MRTRTVFLYLVDVTCVVNCDTFPLVCVCVYIYIYIYIYIYLAHLRQVSQLKICDFLGEKFKGSEVL